MAAVNSADSYISAQPEVIKSFDQWYNEVDGDPISPYTIGGKISNAFTGRSDKLRDQYNAYVQNLNNMNEYKATQSARAWEASAIQRLVKDYEKAGLNPALALFDGSIASSSSGSSKASYSAKGIDRKTNNSNHLAGVAMLIMAIAKVAAAFL